MHDEEYIRQIRDYIAQQQHRYYPEAIRKRLIADGHDPALVDRLLAEAFSNLRPYADPNRTQNKLTSWDMILYVIRIGVIVAGVALFNMLLVGSCFAVLGENQVAAVFMLVIALPVFVGTLVYSRWRQIPVWITAILLLAPVLSLALLIGACIAIIVVAYQ